MSLSQENSKRIAKNTILLYFRMLFLMGISLYTSRVVLNTLGVEDYGIYNVVGGIVAMFGFINSSMASATQRFITSSNPQPIGFSGILLAKRQNSFYCTYFLHNRNVADTKSPYPIKRLEVIRWFNQKSMVFNQSLS